MKEVMKALLKGGAVVVGLGVAGGVLWGLRWLVRRYGGGRGGERHVVVVVREEDIDLAPVAEDGAPRAAVPPGLDGGAEEGFDLEGGGGGERWIVVGGGEIVPAAEEADPRAAAVGGGGASAELHGGAAAVGGAGASAELHGGAAAAGVAATAAAELDLLEGGVLDDVRMSRFIQYLHAQAGGALRLSVSEPNYHTI